YDRRSAMLAPTEILSRCWAARKSYDSSIIRVSMMWELQTVATWVDMLRSDISALGSDAGQMGQSVYDTAQLLLHAPSPDSGRAVNWLLSQQRPDGGWGDPAVPRARVVSTLAAALALHHHGRRITDREAVRAAVSFLDRQAEHWVGPLSDDLPVGIELLIP